MEKIREQKNTIFVCIVTSFITTFMGSALNLSIPAMEAEFKISAQTVGWVITIYMLTCASLAVPFGRLADRMERRKILWLGILIFSLSSLAAVISRKIWVLLVFRAAQGVGASMIFSTNIAILVGSFDESQRGKVLGYATCANYVGLSAGPVLGGILNHNLGWRSIFIATAIVSAVAFCGAFFKLPRTERCGGEEARGRAERTPSAKGAHKIKADAAGNVLFVSAAVLTMYGLSALRTVAAAPFLLAAGVLLMLVFVRREQRIDEPLINIDMFRKNISFTLSNLAASVNYGTNFAISYMLSIYLQVIKGMTSQQAGMVLITGTAVMALLSPAAGKLSDRFSPFLLSAIGMAICAASAGMIAFLPLDVSVPIAAAVLAVSGVGFALFSSPNTKAVMSGIDRKDYGVATSILSTMRSMGHTAGMAMVTAIVGFYMGNGTLTQAQPEILMKTIHTSFFAFTVLCILGIFMAAKRKI